MTEMMVYAQVGPVIESTAWVSQPVIGATTKFSIKVSRDQAPINNAVVTLQVRDIDERIVYPLSSTTVIPTAVVHSATSFAVTHSTATPLSVGSLVTFSGFNPSGWDGTYTVAASPAPTSTSFTVSITRADPGAMILFGVVNIGSGTVTVARDTRYPGLYMVTPSVTTIFTTADGLYRIYWNISVPSDSIYPASVLPLTQLAIAKEPGP